MSKVSFDGINKIISVNPNITSIDVTVDLYSEWKRWVVLENNLKYEQAFRTFGGDPTISGQFAPRYYFLTNGWRILINNGEDVNIGVNLFTDELDNPFILDDNSTVILRNSDAPIVDNGIATRLDYNGIININPIIGVSGTEYPIGTIAKPTNNIVDAKEIGDKLGITTYHIYGPLLIDVDLNNSTIIGGNLNDIITIDGTNLSGTTFKQCIIGGSYYGDIAGDNCILKDSIRGMGGYFQHCGFLGSMYFNDGVKTIFNDCHSQVPGMDSPSIFLGENIDLSVRKYSGGLAIFDTKSGTTATIEYVAGNCRILSGNTSGTLVIRGISSLTDESSGTIINTDGLLIPYNVATQHSLNVNTEILRNKN